MASVGDLLEGKRVCICAGSGGVGKTTTSAAIAAGMAARGKKVAVLTIDPAKRLADSLGLPELGNEERRVDPGLFTEAGVDPGDGELWAMMLDPKATFDEVVRKHAPDEETRERILSNRIYQQLSNALAGSQEYMAMEKLFEIWAEDRYDLLVLDTPPSRNALDFLEAPKRLTQFIEGRALRVFMAPTGIAAKVAGRGTSAVFSILKRITGVDLLQDLAEFFQAMSGMVGGFRERARRVNELLADSQSMFLVVCGPQGEPIDEAVYFHRKLVEAQLPFGGVIVNKVHYAEEAGDDLDDRARRPPGRRGPAPAGGRQLQRLPGTGRARPPQRRAPRQRDAHPGRDPGALPGLRRARPRGPDGGQPLPVRDRGGRARGARGLGVAWPPTS